MNFEWALSAWLGLPATYCIFAPTCGNALAVEHNGDLYSCDHYVYAAYKIGNLMHDDLNHLLDSPIQQKFQQKKSTLPDTCVSCAYCFACHGECPKTVLCQEIAITFAKGTFIIFLTFAHTWSEWQI